MAPGLTAGHGSLAPCSSSYLKTTASHCELGKTRMHSSLSQQTSGSPDQWISACSNTLHMAVTGKAYCDDWYVEKEEKTDDYTPAQGSTHCHPVRDL